MKKQKSTGKITLTLVLGCAVISIMLFAALIGIGFLAGELISRTIAEPTIGNIAMDVVAVVLLVAIVSHKRFRAAAVEIWQQMKRNM